MHEQVRRDAWGRFQDRIRALRERQKSVIARFVRRVEDEKLQSVRSALGDQRR
jgi:hypothetical protein